jgi:hypothetical protein
LVDGIPKGSHFITRNNRFDHSIARQCTHVRVGSEKPSRVRVIEAIRKKLPDALFRPDLEMVALDYFRRLGHDNHRRLSKLYAWEEKKSKTSWVLRQWTTRRLPRLPCKE